MRRPTRMFQAALKILTLLLFISCSDKAIMRRQVRNTIKASGYTSDTSKIFNATKSELHIYDLRPQETVAEIGFGTGWLTGVILIRYDSLIYYANDIDDASLKAIRSVTEKYLRLRTTPNSNQLKIVKGSATKTNLPPDFFDKIIVRETFHHFEYPHEMLLDIKRTMKSNGYLFIYEPSVEETFFNKECGAKNYSRVDLLKFFTDNNFSLVAEHELFDSPGNMPSWWATDKTKIGVKKVFVFNTP